MRSTRVAAALAGVIAIVALFVVLRPDDSGGDASADRPRTTTTPATPTTTDTSATAGTTTNGNRAPTPPRPKETRPARRTVATIAIVVRGGQIVGGVRRATVAKGRRVAVVVRSDVSDHVHVHGYDLFADVRPGRPPRIAFRATVPGLFEIELEDRGVPIALLSVNP